MFDEQELTPLTQIATYSQCTVGDLSNPIKYDANSVNNDVRIYYIN